MISPSILFEEAHNTALLMKSHPWETVLVISDSPHLRQLDRVWRTACAQHGLEYRPIAPRQRHGMPPIGEVAKHGPALRGWSY